MAKPVSVRTDKDHREALDAFVDDGNADSKSEAMRATSRAELAKRGYINGHTNKTFLRLAMVRFSQVFLITGVVWTGLTWYYPRVYAMPAIGLFISGLFLAGVGRALETYEPTVTHKLKDIASWGVKE